MWDIEAYLYIDGDNPDERRLLQKHNPWIGKREWEGGGLALDWSRDC